MVSDWQGAVWAGTEWEREQTPSQAFSCSRRTSSSSSSRAFSAGCPASCWSTRPTGTRWWRSSSPGSRTSPRTRTGSRSSPAETWSTGPASSQVERLSTSRFEFYWRRRDTFSHLQAQERRSDLSSTTDSPPRFCSTSERSNYSVVWRTWRLLPSQIRSAPRVRSKSCGASCLRCCCPPWGRPSTTAGPPATSGPGRWSVLPGAPARRTSTKWSTTSPLHLRSPSLQSSLNNSPSLHSLPPREEVGLAGSCRESQPRRPNPESQVMPQKRRRREEPSLKVPVRNALGRQTRAGERSPQE